MRTRCGRRWPSRRPAPQATFAETFDPQDLGSPQWDVFDADGRYLGEVEFPARFQPLRVHGDRIYGVARDELDVQSLKAFEVVVPGG